MQAVGQAYTRGLKEVSRVLDAALQAGIEGSGKDAANLRWDAVQRLSSILHEAHDAEMQTSRALTIEHLSREKTVMEQESARARAEEDVLVLKIQGQLVDEFRTLSVSHLRELQAQVCACFDLTIPRYCLSYNLLNHTPIFIHISV